VSPVSLRVSRALRAVASHVSRLHAELEHLDALLDGGAPLNEEPDLRGLIRALLADAEFRLKAAGVGEAETRGADGGEAAHDPPSEAPPDPDPGAGAGFPMASAFPEAYPDVGRRRKAAFPSTHLFPAEDRRRRSKELRRLTSSEASPLRKVYGEVRRRGKRGRPRSGSPGKRPGRPPDYYAFDYSRGFENPFRVLEKLGFTRRERLALSRELVRWGHAEYVFECVRLLALSAFRLTGLDERALKEAMEEWWEALSWLTVEPEFLELFRSERWTRETVEDPGPTRPETLAAMCVIRLAVSCIRFDEEEEEGEGGVVMFPCGTQCPTRSQIIYF
jgi:hypothetical protein